MSRVLPLVMLAVLVAGCGQVTRPAQPASGSAETRRATLYFLAEGGAVPLGVRRAIIQRTPPPWGSTAGGALEALLAGPTAEEASAGVTTAIPAEARLISLRHRGYAGTGAVVDLSGLDAVADPLDRARIITQIVRTLVGVSGIERVWLLEEGRPWGMYLMEGGVDNGPFDYDALAGFWLGSACPGTETIVCDSFKALP